MHELIKHTTQDQGNEKCIWNGFLYSNVLPILQGQLAWGRHSFHFPKNALLKTGNIVLWKLSYPCSPLKQKRKNMEFWGHLRTSLKGYFWRHSGLMFCVKKLTWTAPYPGIHPCWSPFSRTLSHCMSISDYNSPSKETCHLEPAACFWHLALHHRWKTHHQGFQAAEYSLSEGFVGSQSLHHEKSSLWLLQIITFLIGRSNVYKKCFKQNWNGKIKI